MTARIWTIGHSTQPLEKFLETLAAYEIRLVVDVRKFPHSRRHPHFNTDELKRALFRAKIQYEWMGMELGGFRKPRADSAHVGLRESSFQGYADHMETPTFAAALARLQALASAQRVAYMCSESNYKSCHRRMISDALQLLHGWQVEHIVDATRALAHIPMPEARPAEGRVLYAARPLDAFGSKEPSTTES